MNKFMLCNLYGSFFTIAGVLTVVINKQAVLLHIF